MPDRSLQDRPEPGAAEARPRPDAVPAAAQSGLPADLDGRTLVEADLAGRDLSGARLAGRDLSRANLEGARLFAADLRGAVLFGARLAGAELSGAQLAGANLEGADLERAGLGRADLSRATLVSARLQGASLVQARLTHADLRMADLRGVRARDADWGGADLSRADLRDAELDGGRVRRARLDGADLRGARLRRLRDFRHASWIGVDLRGIDFTGAYLCRSLIHDQNYLAEFRSQSRLANIVYWVWWTTSDCGRSVLRWSAWTGGLVALFAWLYTLVGVDYGAYPTPLSPLYFSVVTITTLGFGDVVPAGAGGQVVAMLEVVTGYLMLGGLLSIFSKKMASRAD